MSRGCGLTAKKASAIYKAARLGRPRLIQANAGRVHPATLHNWLNKGEAGEVRDDGGTPTYVEFFDKLSEATNEGHEKHFKRIDHFADSDDDSVPASVGIKASELRLRVSLPQLFETRTAIEVTQKETVKDCSEMSREELMGALKGLEEGE